MKHYLLALALSALALSSCESTAPVASSPSIAQPALAPATVVDASGLPDQISLEEEVMTIGTDFAVAGDFGEVKERILHLGTVFEYIRNDSIVARANTEPFSWGTNITVKDGKNRLIGTVEEEKLESLFSINSIYSIKDANGVVVGKSRKLDFFGTSIDIYNLQGQVIASIKRPTFNVVSDRWTIQTNGQNTVDKRILLMIPCFKSESDNGKHHKSKKKK